jgi:hypothetical protein
MGPAVGFENFRPAEEPRIDCAPPAAKASDPSAKLRAATRTKVVRSLLCSRFFMRFLLPPSLAPSVERKNLAASLVEGPGMLKFLLEGDPL